MPLDISHRKDYKDPIVGGEGKSGQVVVFCYFFCKQKDEQHIWEK